MGRDRDRFMIRPNIELRVRVGSGLVHGRVMISIKIHISTALYTFDIRIRASTFYPSLKLSLRSLRRAVL